MACLILLAAVMFAGRSINQNYIEAIHPSVLEVDDKIFEDSLTFVLQNRKSSNCVECIFCRIYYGSPRLSVFIKPGLCLFQQDRYFLTKILQHGRLQPKLLE